MSLLETSIANKVTVETVRFFLVFLGVLLLSAKIKPVVVVVALTRVFCSYEIETNRPC